MAEFHRDRSRLESARGPQYRSALLPWEQQVCETLGISGEEYFEYYDLVAQHIKEEEGRELIPDIKNSGLETAIVLTVVGLVLQGVAYLLTPKPRAPEQRQQGKPFQSRDVRGRTKFAPLAEFDSVQELATLGSLVPLVYTLQQGDHGGVRVESQLLWSRMRNSPTYQELRALLLFSAGELDTDPDFFGYAFGDSKMAGYSAPKISLWFNRGLSRDANKNAFPAANKPFANFDDFQYPEGTRKTGSSSIKPFFTDVIGDDGPSRMLFCGTVTPSQSAVFGQYSPIRNGHGWKYDFKWPGKGDGDAGKKEMLYGTRAKHVAGYHAGRTTLQFNDGGREIVYTIHDNDSDKIYYASDKVDSSPARWTKVHFDSSGKLLVRDIMRENDSLAEDVGGVTEGLTAIDQSKINADTALDTGEMYLIGTDIFTCTGRRNLDGEDGTPYEPRESGSVQYEFKREQEFYKGYVEDKWIRTEDSDDIYDEKHIPIQKVAVGSIATTRAVDAVEIGFKSQVWKQIQGYPNIAQFSYKDIANDYAKEQQTWQPGTIQAYYDRLSMFRMEVKQEDGAWRDWSKDELFAVHGKNPQAQYNQIWINLPEKKFYEFRFIPVSGNAWLGNEFYKTKDVYVLNARKTYQYAATRNGVEVWFKGDKYKSIEDAFKMEHPYWSTGEDEKPNQNTNSLLNDFWFFDSDKPSHENEPEHQITWINEYVQNSDTWYAHEDRQYEHLAHAGLICRSATEISSFSNFSAYITQGIRVKKFIGSSTRPEGATNNFPEIAFDLLTNRRYGVGEFIGRNAVDEDLFNVAAEFCNANGFYWDGVISEAINVREFLFSQAGYQLLDFTIKGGQFSLTPAVPYKSDYSIDLTATAGSPTFPIKALFTNGNVRNYKTTFMSPEERELFIAEVKYRKEIKNEFPETHVTRVRLAETEGGYSRDPVEIFDMTQFCTSRDHAIRFAKFALRVRQAIDHSISFETTPDAAHTLSPGDYIRVAVSIQHQERDRGYTSRLRSGSVAPNGTVQVTEGLNMQSDDVNVYYWKPGFDGVRTGTLRIRNGITPDISMRGIMFTRRRTDSESRVYKIESIAYSEDSFVEITAAYTPLTQDQQMQILQWDDSDFVIEDQQG